MASSTGWAIVASLLFATGLIAGAKIGRPGNVVRIEADTSLQDVAAARPVDGTIIINPRYWSVVPPELGTFFMQHELAHIALHHGKGGSQMALELEADCWAAAHSRPEENTMAIRFFSLMGPYRLASTHPTGLQRAKQIMDCLP